MEELFPLSVFLLFFFLLNQIAEASSSSSPFWSPFIASIDCGGAGSFYDERSIAWISDSSLTAAGEARSVPESDGFSIPMRTLRVFHAGERNCYSIAVSGEGQILVRASFFYGNYDGRSSPPTFDLEFDGNHWATVWTAEDEVVRHEAIYEARGGGTSVCLVRTKAGEIPFLSAIEVRSLGEKMYGKYDRNTSALVLAGRVAAGRYAVVRHPDDPFDRIWSPSPAPASLTVIENAAITVSANINDLPPQEVLQAAFAPVAGINTITLVPPVSGDPVLIYINLYFTEVAVLAAGDRRSFIIYVDGAAASGTITPPFGGVGEFFITDITVTNSTRITLRPTPESTLPPIISAVEAFVIVKRREVGGSDGAAMEDGSAGAVLHQDGEL